MKDRTSSSKKERGVALLIALFALMLLAAVAFEMMYVADVETVVNDNFRSSQRSYDAAWSGLQEARERLMPSNTAPHKIVGPVALPGVPGSIIYILNPRTPEVIGSIDPTLAANAFFDNEICHENFVGLGLANPGIGIPCAAGPPAGSVTYVNSDAPFTSTAGALDYKWVRITQKANNTVNPGGGVLYGLVTGSTAVNGFAPPIANTISICWNGTNQIPKPVGYVTCDDNPPPAPSTTYLKTVYILTSLAVTQTGARRMAQMEVALDPPFITNAALDTDDLVNTVGSSLTINGYDNCKCLCTIAKGNAVPNCVDRVTAAPCTGNTYSIFTSQTVTSSGAPALIAGTTPAVIQNQVYPYDVPALVTKYSNAAGAVNVTGPPYNMSCTPSSCGTTSTAVYGTPPNPFPPTNVQNPPGLVNQITYFPGSIDLQAHTKGAGILVVDGNLTVHGGIDFYGLIIVRGTLTFAGGGAGQSNNIIGGVVAGNGQQAGGGVIADALSGSINMQFDSCALNNNSIVQPPGRIAFRELEY